jgi:hypothetical protein
MLDLQRLAAIFEGALPARQKDTTSPICKINDIDAPPRVKIAVSPLRVINGTTPARAVYQHDPKFTSEIKYNTDQSSYTQHHML